MQRSNVQLVLFCVLLSISDQIALTDYNIIIIDSFNPRALWAPASFLQEGRYRTTNMGAPPHCSSPI